MEAKRKITFYEKLVYTAYAFYILLSATWLIMSLIFGSYFNYQAFIVLAVFAVQAYYKHKLANLLLGILLFALSIISALDFMLMGGKTGFFGFVDIMMALSVCSIILSGILIFSYTKLSFMET